MMQALKWCLAIFLICVYGNSLAETESMFGVDVPSVHYDSGEDELAKLKESGLELPAFPQRENLIPFDVSESFGFQFFIDTKSLSVGKDEIIRYVVILVSSEGATTAYYEGMRCSTREIKRFAEAFSESQGKWSLSRDPSWVTVSTIGRNNYRFALYNDYWCNVGAPIFSTKDMIRAIKRGGYGPSDTLYDKSL